MKVLIGLHAEKAEADKNDNQERQDTKKTGGQNRILIGKNSQIFPIFNCDASLIVTCKEVLTRVNLIL